VEVVKAAEAAVEAVFGFFGKKLIFVTSTDKNVDVET
jgi:hypothetical protein